MTGERLESRSGGNLNRLPEPGKISPSIVMLTIEGAFHVEHAVGLVPAKALARRQRLPASPRGIRWFHVKPPDAGNKKSHRHGSGGGFQVRSGSGWLLLLIQLFRQEANISTANVVHRRDNDYLPGVHAFADRFTAVDDLVDGPPCILCGD